MSALETLKNVNANRLEAAKAFKAAGGKVVGYFDDAVPLEPILAAGMMPLRIAGDPNIPFTTLEKYLYPIWKKHGLSDKQVKLDYINSILDRMFKGDFEFVDYAIIPYSRKGVLGIWAQLTHAKQYYPDLVIPDLFVLDRAITPTFDSSVFNKESVLLMIAKLEEWSGRKIMDKALAEAITKTNAQRDAIAALGAIRRERRISGADALAVISASKFMDIDEHTRLLKDVVADHKSATPRAGSAVFFAGSPQDNDQFYRLIEKEGATITGENHYWGSLLAEYPVSTDFSPVDGIGDMYHKRPASIVYPLQRAIDEVVQRAQDAKADSVVIVNYAYDNHEPWVVPDTRAALDDAGIPNLYLHTQPYNLGDGKEQSAAVRSFFKKVVVNA